MKTLTILGPNDDSRRLGQADPISTPRAVARGGGGGRRVGKNCTESIFKMLVQREKN